MYKNNQLWNRYFPRSQRISYQYRETPRYPSIYSIDLNQLLLLFLLTITKQKYFSSSPKLFVLLCCLWIYPRSLWFDLGTPRNILLRSPTLGSEQAIASILSPSIFTKPTLTFLPLNSFGIRLNPFDILAWCWSPFGLIRFGFGLKVNTVKKREDERKRRKKMKGFALVEEEVLEPIDLIWFDWAPQVLVWWCKWENFGVHLYPKRGFKESLHGCACWSCHFWKSKSSLYSTLRTTN